MNGRCETDPFDQAVDVCGSCHGEFCSSCLVQTRGRKHPICRDCAVILSGVRPGARTPLRGSKKTAKRRRAELKAAPVEERFRYFDDETAAVPASASTPLPASTLLPSAPAAPADTALVEAQLIQPEQSLAEPTADVVAEATSLDETQQPAPASAVDQLHRIRAGDLEAEVEAGVEDVDDQTDDGAPEFRGPRPFIETDDSPRGMAALLQHLEDRENTPESHPNRRHDDPTPGRPAATPGAVGPLPRRRDPAGQPRSGGLEANAWPELPRRRAAAPSDPTPAPGPTPPPAPAPPGDSAAALPRRRTHHDDQGGERA